MGSSAGVCCCVLFLAIGGMTMADTAGTEPGSTSTDWRNDEMNIEMVRLLNDSWAHFLFSKQYEGVLDDPPFSIE